ncbi:hypothetical protein PENSUB_4033 [Penicillium subrubescens]|uniref:Uncharacterized protein n=1 Tax=Penicillium subrubescens TaxID=1316194 RepID=A0A1Q5UE34_9EURO|nr:hypothetical protein PENSUB_4033 [Penicillium subrubescens]
MIGIQHPVQTHPRFFSCPFPLLNRYLAPLHCSRGPCTRVSWGLSYTYTQLYDEVRTETEDGAKVHTPPAPSGSLDATIYFCDGSPYEEGLQLGFNTE